jgi:hypothetical protein
MTDEVVMSSTEASSHEIGGGHVKASLPCHQNAATPVPKKAKQTNFTIPQKDSQTFLTLAISSSAQNLQHVVGAPHQ